MSTEWLDPYIRPLYRLLRHWNKMSVYANEGFYVLGGFAKVVIAIDGSVVLIITSTNASVHPPQETVDRVYPPPSPPPVILRHVPSLFVRFSFVFVAFGQSVNFISNSKLRCVAPCCCCSIPYQRLDMTSRPNNDSIPFSRIPISRVPLAASFEPMSV